MKILVTGSAGFIGFHTAIALAKAGHEVVGLDNINDYYDVRLKFARGEESGFSRSEMESGRPVSSTKYPGYKFIKADISDMNAVASLFKEHRFDVVCNLAAQAGVRYSIENPHAYIKSNIDGFLNVLEACRRFPVKQLVYASSSSVYGLNEKVPFSETDRTDSPVSLYAATKKADELMAGVYSKLYSIPATGLRFFTVYGPWGRPDMAPMLFLKAIEQGKPIKVFNNGELYRDFTFIDDIVKGVVSVAETPVPAGENLHRIYNIGNSKPVRLTEFIETIEKVSGKSAIKEMTGMQQGDVFQTYADTSMLEKDFGYRPDTPLSEGIEQLYKWFVNHSDLF